MLKRVIHILIENASNPVSSLNFRYKISFTFSIGFSSTETCLKIHLFPWKLRSINIMACITIEFKDQLLRRNPYTSAALPYQSSISGSLKFFNRFQNYLFNGQYNLISVISEHFVTIHDLR